MSVTPPEHPLSQTISADRVKDSAGEDAVACVEPVQNALSVPDHCALQLDSGAEFGTRADHEVAFDSCAGALCVGDRCLIGELLRVEVGGEVLGGGSDGFPDEIL